MRSNGRWRSVWTLKFKDGDASAKLRGSCEVTVHYYEDGNVQLKTKQEKVEDVSVKDDAATAKAIAAAIAKAESAYQVCVHACIRVHV